MEQFIVDYIRKDGSKGRELFERYTIQGASLHFSRIFREKALASAKLYIWTNCGWMQIDTMF